jgi:hypothetical protein
MADEMEVVSFGEHFTDEETLAAALADFDTVVTLRERRRSTRCSVLRRRRGGGAFPGVVAGPAAAPEAADRLRHAQHVIDWRPPRRTA